VANHLTPTQLAQALGRDRDQVIRECVEMGVPIFHGRVDRHLFEVSLRHRETKQAARRSA
jgi:hypothetical protein